MRVVDQASWEPLDTITQEAWTQTYLLPLLQGPHTRGQEGQDDVQQCREKLRDMCAEFVENLRQRVEQALLFLEWDHAGEIWGEELVGGA